MTDETVKRSHHLQTLRRILILLVLGELLALAALALAWPAAPLECSQLAEYLRAFGIRMVRRESGGYAVQCSYKDEPFPREILILFPTYPASMAGLVMLTCLFLTVLVLRQVRRDR